MGGGRLIVPSKVAVAQSKTPARSREAWVDLRVNHVYVVSQRKAPPFDSAKERLQGQLGLEWRAHPYSYRVCS